MDAIDKRSRVSYPAIRIGACAAVALLLLSCGNGGNDSSTATPGFYKGTTSSLTGAGNGAIEVYCGRGPPGNTLIGGVGPNGIGYFASYGGSVLLLTGLNGLGSYNAVETFLGASAGVSASSTQKN